MKFSSICSIFILLFTLACTRSTPSRQQQNDPVLPPPVEEKAATYSFGEAILKGSGNEPFWSLQIDKNQTLMLKSIDDHQFKINTPITKIARVNDANALHLTAATTDKKITIMLMENGCQDSMSGKKSSHGLQVLIKDGTTGNSVLYKGCGEFLNDYLVTNRWQLESINDKKMANLATERTPTLNINLLENKINGFDGCNTFFGMVEMEAGRLKFKNMGFTKKACRNNPTEDIILRLLNDNGQKHKITEDGKLLLKNSEGTLIFKPTK